MFNSDFVQSYYDKEVHTEKYRKNNTIILQIITISHKAVGNTQPRIYVQHSFKKYVGYLKNILLLHIY